MKPYADTNFLTRLYLALPGAPDAAAQMRRLQDGGRRPLPVTWLHRVETVNAFQLLVFASAQSPHQPRVTREQAAAALATFHGDIASGDFLQLAAPDAEDLESRFVDLSLRHTARHGFRAYDLLHVASALVLDCDAFWSFDPKAAALAALEGLKPR